MVQADIGRHQEERAGNKLKTKNGGKKERLEKFHPSTNTKRNVEGGRKGNRRRRMRKQRRRQRIREDEVFYSGMSKI